jgi:hypothetical protein
LLKLFLPPFRSLSPTHVPRIASRGSASVLDLVAEDLRHEASLKRGCSHVETEHRFAIARRYIVVEPMRGNSSRLRRCALRVLDQLREVRVAWVDSHALRLLMLAFVIPTRFKHSRHMRRSSGTPAARSVVAYSTLRHCVSD